MSVVMGRRWVLASWLRIGFAALKLVAIVAVAAVAVTAVLKLPQSSAILHALRIPGAGASDVERPANAAARGPETSPSLATDAPAPSTAAADVEDKPAAPPVQTKPASPHRKHIARARKPASDRQDSWREGQQRSWGFAWLKWPNWWSDHRGP